jgi:hypothetical protein
MDDGHVGIDTYDDPIGQIMSPHHWRELNGHLVRSSGPFRYGWPSELDLMGRVAASGPVQRWAGWLKEPFTADSRNQVAVFEKSS